MLAVVDIKKDLPNWPDDVIDQWLLYFANEPDCGWPPPDPLGNHRWSGILGGRPLSWWKEVTWKIETVDCSFAKLSDKSRAIATELSASFIAKTADAITSKRVKEPYIYIFENGCFPKPVLMMKVATGLSVLDGNHRMAAFHTLQKTPDASFKKQNKEKTPIQQNAWIGTHKAAEVPLT
jgi:hypothetical protein